MITHLDHYSEATAFAWAEGPTDPAGANAPPTTPKNMKTIYAIRDRIANDLAGYFPLVVFRTDAQAVRYFADSCAQDKSAIGAHPDDYELVASGTIEDDGEITSFGKPRIIITGSALVSMQTEHKGA